MKHPRYGLTALFTIIAILFATVSPPAWAQSTKAGVDALNEFKTVTYTSARTAAGAVSSATTVLTSNGTNVSNNDTVTLGSKTYTFKTSLTPTEGEVLIGGNAAASLLNLIRAVNHTGTPDTDYKCATANTTVSAASAVSSNTVTFTARTAGLTGDALASTEAAATLSFPYTTFSGGGAYEFDTNEARNFAATLSAANRSINLTNAKSGRRIVLKLKQDATGSRTVIWDSAIRWSGGTAPTLTTTASRSDLIEFIDTGTYWLGSVIAQNFSES